MRIHLQEARDEDAAAIAALRMATSRQLTADYGHGTWSYTAETEWSVRADMITAHIYIARLHGVVAATLRLSVRPPWLGAIDFFTPVATPLYLTTMAVAPKFQRQGIGRACLEAAKRIAARWPADALRLDAYDAAAGAGDFYRKTGFTEVKRGKYNGTPLIYFEYLVPKEAVQSDLRSTIYDFRAVQS
jgi:ribosomal protein S18 acetylase RimI-like enzyme